MLLVGMIFFFVRVFVIVFRSLFYVFVVLGLFWFRNRMFFL